VLEIFCMTEPKRLVWGSLAGGEVALGIPVVQDTGRAVVLGRVGIAQRRSAESRWRGGVLPFPPALPKSSLETHE